MAYGGAAWKEASVKEAFEIVGKLAQYTEPTTVANANGDNFKKNQQLILTTKRCSFQRKLVRRNGRSTSCGRLQMGRNCIAKVGEDGTAYATTFTEQIYIPKDAKYPDRAKKFLTFVYSGKAVKAFCENGGALMPVKGITDVGVKMMKTVFTTVFMNQAQAPNGVGFMVMDNMPEGVKRIRCKQRYPVCDSKLCSKR